MKPHLVFSNYDDLKNPYYAGGGALAIHQVAKRLTKFYRISVFTGAYPGSKDQLIDGVSYHRIGLSFGGPALGHLSFLLSLPFYLLTTKFDVWIESFVPPISSPFLSLFSRKPIIGLVHMLPAIDMERKYHLPFRWWENLILKSHHHFIVLTQESSDQILAQNPQAKISIIPNGVDLPVLSKAPDRHLLFMGRLEHNQKGLDLLLKSYVLSAVKVPLVVAGSGNLPRTTLPSSVKFVGSVSGDVWRKLYKEALFVILPSRFETFSLVALETLSYAKPLLCFRIPGLSWIPESVAIKIKPFDTNLFAKAIKRLSTDKKLRLKLSKSGRKFASNFSWDHASQAYLKTITSFI